jgi:RHS repeat-associated protein
MIFSGEKRIVAKTVGTGALYFYHPDHLGSTNVVTDSNGIETQRVNYAPFGEVRDTPIPSVAHKYTGKERDSATGLYWYEWRSYDPVLARFTTPDTLVPNPRDPQDLNRYSYVGNNPLRYTDPTGHGKFKINPAKFFRHLTADISKFLDRLIGGSGCVGESGCGSPPSAGDASRTPPPDTCDPNGFCNPRQQRKSSTSSPTGGRVDADTSGHGGSDSNLESGIESKSTTIFGTVVQGMVYGSLNFNSVPQTQSSPSVVSTNFQNSYGGEFSRHYWPQVIGGDIKVVGQSRHMVDLFLFQSPSNQAVEQTIISLVGQILLLQPAGAALNDINDAIEAYGSRSSLTTSLSHMLELFPREWNHLQRKARREISTEHIREEMPQDGGKASPCNALLDDATRCR